MKARRKGAFKTPQSPTFDQKLAWRTNYLPVSVQKYVATTFDLIQSADRLSQYGLL